MAKIIDFFDGVESSTTPTIGSVSATELEVYANDAGYEAVNGPAASGSMYYNSTLNVVRSYNAGSASWVNHVTSGSTGINATSIADGSVSSTEFQYINSLTSNAQTQLTQNASDITQVASDLADHENAIASHAANTIVNVPSGNLVATDVQAALDELQSDIDDRVLTSDVGQPNGVASLDGAGKVPVTQLPNSIMEYQGTWNASTNTPTLADGVGNTGDVYRVTVAGSQDLGSGSITFGVGDYAIYNTSGVWEKADTTDAVSSVNGTTGAVIVNAINELTGDVTAGPASGSESKTATIAANAVTFSKIQDISTDKLIGRDTASSGDPEEISVTGGLEFSGSGSIQRSALTGDVTASAGSNSTTIANDAVTNAKLDNMATQTFKGRTTAGAGDPEDLTATQATAILDTFVGDSGSGGTKGLVPAPATGDATKYLKGDGTWAAVTVSTSTVTTATALANATTFTLAHGLGRVPINVIPSLLVTTSVANWAVNDEIPRWVDGLTAVADSSIFVGCDATNILVRCNNTNVSIFNKTTGASTAAAVTNFKLKVYYQ